MTEPSEFTGGNPSAESFDAGQWSALLLLCTAAFMIVLDSSTVVTALPTIQTDLGFSASSLHWVATSYVLTFGGLMLLGGRLADLFGRRRVFMIGTVVFIATSALCGLAWSSDVLIAGRFLQGVGAAIALPAALSILMSTFEEGPARNKALGFWLATGTVGGVIGYIIGGLLTDGPGWEWIFYVNVPVGIGVLALSPVLFRVGKS
ncbi:MFS transporter [Halostagnicola bangensis]